MYLLIQTLQCEQKHIIHESLLQTFNSPVISVNYFFALNDYDAITNIIPYLGGFFFYGMVIRPHRIFLLHISGSVHYWFHFLCITCSVQHYHHLDWGKEGWSICCCLSVSLHTCMLPLLCSPIWLYANDNMWFIMFTLHHHHCSFITDEDLTHIWYTNLIIYKT